MEPGQRVTDTYQYTDEEGNVLYEVLRIEPGPVGQDGQRKKKEFKQRRVLPDGTLAWGLTKETRRVLYNLPAVLAAGEVALCCGEKDCKTATELGFVATTNSGGEGIKWIDENDVRAEFVESLDGKHVLFFPDNDTAGRLHAENIIQALDGIAASLAIVWLPRGKDLTDFMRDEGGTNDELAALIAVAKLPENAPVKKLKALVRKKGEPCARESEKLILGALMHGTVPFSDVSELHPDEFFIPHNKVIFRAIEELDVTSGAIDIKSVIQYLEQKDRLDAAGGVTYLVDLVEDLPGAYNIDAHIEAIKSKYQARFLLDKYVKSAEQILIGGDIEQIKSELVLASENSSVYSSSRIATATAEEISRDIKAFIAPKTQGIMCKPINQLMEECYGFHRGQLVIVAGRPSNGKSSLAGEICAYAAGEQKQEVELISLEVSREEALLKMCCQMAKVSYMDVIAGRMTARQEERLIKWVKIFHNIPLRIDDDTSWTVAKIRNHLKRREAAGKPVRLLCIDYLQLMGSGRQDGRRDLEIGAITRGLKLIAKEFNVTVLLLSQLSRAGEHAGRRPALIDLRESGSIEQDADVVIFVYQIYDGDSPDANERQAELILAKQRNGGTGTFLCRFAKKYTLFFMDSSGIHLDYLDLAA